MTGNFSKSGSERICFISSTPVILGSIRSRMTASGRNAWTISSPANPSSGDLHLKAFDGELVPVDVRNDLVVLDD